MILTLGDVAIIALMCTAAWSDATTHRIPNWLSVTGLATGLMLRAPLGLGAFLSGLEGAGLALLVSLVLYALRAIGAGDVKLLAAAGAFFGSQEVVGAMALVAVLGGVFALASMIRRGLLPLLLFNTADLLKSWRGSRTVDSPGALTIPYGVPIALGTLIWWFVEGVHI